MFLPSKTTGRRRSLLDPLEIGLAKLVPLGDQDQSVGALAGLITLAAVRDVPVHVLEQGFRFLGRFGIVCLHSRSLADQAANQGERRRFAHVIGSGLEGEAPKGHRLPVQIVLEVVSNLREQEELLVFVHRLGRFDQLELEAGVPRGAGEGADVLRKTRAAVSGAGEEKGVADAAVRTDRPPHLRHVRAHLLAEARDLVHEADSAREHRVRRILGQLRALRIHHQHGISRAHERPIELFHELRGLGIVGADHHPVGPEEVVDRGSFLQKLRVRHHAHRVLGRRSGYRFFDSSVRAHRDGALEHHDLRLVHGPGDSPSHREHMAHVGRAVLVLRRTHGDEQDFRADHGVVEVGSEGEPLFGDVPGNELREPRLVDGNLAALEAGDLVLVDIDGDDVVAVLGEARAEHQAHVSGSKDGDLHM